MTRRTIVLLGAGSSVDAGLPLTSQLAERVVAKFNARGSRQPGLAELNFVYSAMVGHQGEDGSNPLRAVNIETLISAVRLLQARESHEVAPFVSSWKAGALGFSTEQRPTRGYGSDVRSAIFKAIKDEHWGGDDLADLIAKIAAEVADRSDPLSYRRLEEALLLAIRDELQAIGSVDYLTPLADLAISQAGGLDVVTLNYDLTVETMAASAGVKVDRGIDRWEPGVPLRFEPADGQINLYKLHGSLDWELLERTPRTVHPPRIQVVAPEPPSDNGYSSAAQSRHGGLPWIVVGDREKLATDGPTLDLLHAATEALRRADSLVVVGYSFADAHINAVIRNWLAADDTRTMTVVDPGWPPFDSREARGHLAYAYGGGQRVGEPVAEPRLAVIAEATATALPAALALVPSAPEVGVTAAWVTDWSAGEVSIEFAGYSLDDVTVTVSADGQQRSSNVFESAEARDRGQVGWFIGGPRFGHQSMGSRISVFLSPDQVAGTVVLNVSGRDLLGYRRFTVTLEGSPPTAELEPDSDSTSSPP